MEIGAVTLLGVTSVERVAASPTGAGLVVTHGAEHVVVNGSSLIERRGLTLGHFYRQVGREPSDGNQLVGLQVFFAIAVLKLDIGKVGSSDTYRQPLVTDHIVDDFKMQIGRFGFGNLRVVHIVS